MARRHPTPPAHVTAGAVLAPIRTLTLALILALGAGLLPAAAQTDRATGGAGLPGTPYRDMITVATPHGFDAAFQRVVAAVEAAGLIPVTRASASRAAAGRGIDIPGNGVIDAFNNDFAVRLLSANVAAGFEAPIRLYLTQTDDGTTRLSYRPPSAVFAPYDDPAVDTIAAELDRVFAAIVEDAAAAP